MSGKGTERDAERDGSGGVERSDRADRGRDYGDSAGFGGGGAALDYDDVLGDTGHGRRVENNPLDAVIPDPGGPSEEAVRIRAYSKWEAAGRPEGRDEEFWHQAEREVSS